MKFLQQLFDRFTLILIAVVALATILPPQGRYVAFFDGLTHVGIALLFFLHGARLSRRAIIDGAMHWRLHLLVFLCTFALFPLLGLALQPLMKPLLGDALWLGMLYLCLLPGTVQSAIAFTSIARGNVPAAVCAASASSLVGIVVTPLLAGLVLGSTGPSASPSSGNSAKVNTNTSRCRRQCIAPSMIARRDSRAPCRKKSSAMPAWVSPSKRTANAPCAGRTVASTTTAVSRIVKRSKSRRRRFMSIGGRAGSERKMVTGKMGRLRSLRACE